MKHVKNVAAYLRLHPPAVRAQLETIRQIVLKTVPGAEESISYGMPAYKYLGVLIYFAATQKHFGLYAMPSAVEAFQAKLAGFDTSKGTIRFPIDQPVPKKLITEIVKFRKLENEAKAGSKK